MKIQENNPTLGRLYEGAGQMADNTGGLRYLQMRLGRYVGNWAQKNGHLHGAMGQAMIPGSEFFIWLARLFLAVS